jgi:hypothetical protein
MRNALDAERAWRAQARVPTTIPCDGTRPVTAAPAKKADATPDIDESRQPPARALLGERPPLRTVEKPGEPIQPPERAHKWYLKLPDGSVYGPVAPSVLGNWAVQGRVVPTNEVSQDGSHWFPASAIPALIAYWVDGPIDQAKASPQLATGENRIFPGHASEIPDRRMACGRGLSEAATDRIHRRKIDLAQQEATDSHGDGPITRVFQRELQLIRNWPL